MRCTQFILLSLNPKKENCMSQNTVTMLVPTSKNISSFSCNDCLEEIIAGGRY